MIGESSDFDKTSESGVINANRQIEHWFTVSMERLGQLSKDPKTSMTETSPNSQAYFPSGDNSELSAFNKCCGNVLLPLCDY
jgi:hypothetical protein